MRMRISQKIGLLDLMNRTQFKKVTGKKQPKKVYTLTVGFFNVAYSVLLLHVQTFQPLGGVPC